MEICMLCGNKKKLDKHHIDYNKNITIKVCRVCHKAIHEIEKETREIRKPLDKPVELSCKTCENVWIYKGMNPFYATCSHCLNKVKVPRGE